VLSISAVASAEGLAEAMSNGASPAPSTLLWLEELATSLVRGSWAGSTILPFLCEMYDCPGDYAPKARKNPISVIEPTLSLLSASNAEWLWKNLNETDFRGGFGSRLLFLTGPPGPHAGAMLEP
jgi:hypothetical protein